MTALAVDLVTLSYTRDLFAAGHIDQGIAALDALITRSPKREGREATPKQRYLLSGLTVTPWLTWKNDALLTAADASRIITELENDGETTYHGGRLILTEKGKAILAKRKKKSTIPW